MNHAQPQTRQVREHGQAEARPQLRLIRVLEQSASASSPGQQAREQSVHIRGNDAASTAHDPAAATDMDTPQTDNNPEHAVTAAPSLAGIIREPG